MLQENEKLFLIKTLYFWDKLTQIEQNMLLENILITKHNTGESVYNGIKECLGVIIVYEGSLRTFILSEEGREITLFRLDKAEICMLSASCVLKNISFDIHIDAEKESTLFIINPTFFSYLIEKNIFAENFSYKETVNKFSDVMWAMEQVLFMRFDKRLAIFLVDESKKNKSLNINLTHEQIAKYTGSAREVVSRMLKYFEKEKMVKLFRGGLTIIDINKLIGLI